MHILHALIASSFLLISTSCVQAESCTKDQAMNKMMAIGRESQKRLLDVGMDHNARLKQVELNKEVADVGAIIAAGKYSEACKQYADIAKRWNIDLNEASKGMLTMEDLKKDGGKSKGGKCSLAEASIRVSELGKKLQDMEANGDEVDAISSEYYRMIESKGDLMSTNPSAFCDEIDGFKKKYSLE